jgi:predicted nucleic acid-binding Zn ribbon protein
MKIIDLNDKRKAPAGGSLEPVGPARHCVVCGACVRYRNPKTTTCDPVCTAARNNGRTRTQQIVWKLEHPEHPKDDEEFCVGCGMFTNQSQCWDGVDGIN